MYLSASYPQERIAKESVAAGTIFPAQMTSCSQTAGWTSLLVRTFENPATVEPFEMAATPDQLIVLMTSGQCRVSSFANGMWRDGESLPGMGGMTAGGKTSRMRWHSRTHATFATVHIYIPQQTIASTIDEYRRGRSAYRTDSLDALVFDDPSITQVCLTLVEASKSGAPNLYAQSAAQFLVTHLLSTQSRWPSYPQDNQRSGTLSERRLSHVLEYMAAMYMQPLSLEVLAREAAVSRFHFVQLFRKQYGITPHRHLMLLRMTAAATMLVETDMSLIDIALACGYHTVSHFSSAFRRHFSQTPYAYRLRAGNGSVADETGR